MVAGFAFCLPYLAVSTVAIRVCTMMVACPLLIGLQFHLGAHSRKKFQGSWLHRLEKQELEERLQVRGRCE
jgi:hypothetical protein